MKPLHLLNSVEKARLLADMLPDERVNILEAVRLLYAEWKNKETQVRKAWNNPILTADCWYTVAGRVNDNLMKYGDGLLKNNRRLADCLFDGYDALFTVDCLQKYVERGRASTALRAAIQFLFPERYTPDSQAPIV